MSFELYKIPEGKVGIAHSDDKFSIGYLELNPGKELAKHNRPVPEQLRHLSFPFGLEPTIIFVEPIPRQVGHLLFCLTIIFPSPEHLGHLMSEDML